MNRYQAYNKGKTIGTPKTEVERAQIDRGISRLLWRVIKNEA